MQIKTILKNKLLINTFKFLFTFSILYYLVQSGRLNLENLFLFVQHPWLFFSLLMILIFWSLSFTSLRWWFLLKSNGIRLSLFRAYVLTWIGAFFNATLPGAVSGDVVKGYYVIKSNKEKSKAIILMTLLIDRFIGLFGLIVLAFFALVFNINTFLDKPALQPFIIIISGLFVGMVIFYSIVLLPFEEEKDPFIKILGKLPGNKFFIKLYGAFKSYRHAKSTLFFTLLFSILIHLGTIFIFYQFTLLLGIENLAWYVQFFILPLGLITTVIPIAPGGIGVGHAAFQSLYYLFGIDKGADIFNLYIILQLLVYALGGIPYFAYSSDYKPSEEETE